MESIIYRVNIWTRWSLESRSDLNIHGWKHFQGSPAVFGYPAEEITYFISSITNRMGRSTNVDYWIFHLTHFDDKSSFSWKRPFKKSQTIGKTELGVSLTSYVNKELICIKQVQEENECFSTVSSRIQSHHHPHFLPMSPIPPVPPFTINCNIVYLVTPVRNPGVALLLGLFFFFF